METEVAKKYTINKRTRELVPVEFNEDFEIQGFMDDVDGFVPVSDNQTKTMSDAEVYDWNARNHTAFGKVRKPDGEIARITTDVAEGFAAPLSSIAADVYPAHKSKEFVLNAARGADVALVGKAFAPVAAGGRALSYAGRNILNSINQITKPLQFKRKEGIFANPARKQYQINAAKAHQAGKVNEFQKDMVGLHDARLEKALEEAEKSGYDATKSYNAAKESMARDEQIMRQFGTEYDLIKAEASKRAMSKGALREAVEETAEKTEGVLMGAYNSLNKIINKTRPLTAIGNAGMGHSERESIDEWLQMPMQEAVQDNTRTTRK